MLLESKPDDISPFVDAFEATETTESVHVVGDGADALDFLHQRGDYTGAPRPDLILLDLHISAPDGTAIMTELNDQSKLRHIPVIVVTASTAAEDIARSYEFNANAYVQKPDTAEGFEELAEAIEQFWLRVAHLPPK